MYQILLSDASLFRFLLGCDAELAEEFRGQGCTACGDVLHRADYLRRPKGEPRGLDGELWRRHSFCCRRQGCRKRHAPPSLLFLGRRVYLGVIVVLVAALREGPTPTRLARLQELVGVSARTVRRWQRWWKEQFPQTVAWRTLRGLLARPADQRALPGALLDRLAGTARERLVGLLRLLGPLTRRPAADHAF